MATGQVGPRVCASTVDRGSAGPDQLLRTRTSQQPGSPRRAPRFVSVIVAALVGALGLPAIAVFVAPQPAAYPRSTGWPLRQGAVVGYGPVRERYRTAGALVALLVAACLGALLPGASRGAPAPCPLVPQLREVMVNQGLATYPRFVGGKETLVRLYLSGPSCAANGASIQLTGGTLTVGANGVSVLPQARHTFDRSAPRTGA